ncbi:putative eucarytic translation initiation factor 5A [Monocercomonoides exilis]|uniref:putative eucarytic translation initiation factor 5A n=1 Tax=Monocercomonoides exilis TaxID=2049356 RepID=UPI00355952A6|nr:putative eucarytic translation initiation factor 5A [Monocercomonoides exilis]|eukprot:MONOS_8369.1-p1 / transcript=MONOS_8369.1 / gene=MONOS_8369 / organism=Monocercomonoides_exilis_PA203 / gene_product=eucarytic translation initiation factor 5A / transcript_product=eucarytic translation initiation factor 5A / location=Mono_scaffold00314:23342-23812(+) / protein_length=156 / sequence_SO=supercontig / SO=protein_coding / is_pseudo=false
MCDITEEDFAKISEQSIGCSPAEAGDLKKNGFIVLKGHPAKIVQIAITKTGKHGHEKVSLTALDIFTNKKFQGMFPASTRVMVPEVEKKDYQVLDILENNELSLLDDEFKQREDLDVEDEEMAESIREALDEGDDVDVSVVSSLGQEKVFAMRRRK